MHHLRSKWGRTALAGALALALCGLAGLHGAPAAGQTVVAVGNDFYSQSSPCRWTAIVALAAGTQHTVGLRADGTVVAVGLNAGACDVSDWSGIAAIAAAHAHTAGLMGDGTVVVAGHDPLVTCDVSGWRGITAIAAGGDWRPRDHIVGLKGDGTVVAVGSNSSGQCNVSGWRQIAAVAAGNDFTVGLRSDGTLVAVGDNSYGQCEVSGWSNIVAIAAGGSRTVGLRRDGTAVATGYNVSGWRGVTSVAVGTYHAVGLRGDGTVVAVGNNSSGQCNVAGWRGIAAIAAGGDRSVGLKADGTVMAIGYNRQGQCQVSDWNDIVSVCAGGDHTVGLRRDGTVVAVGSNSSWQCDVSQWRDITAIAAFADHTIGLTRGGGVLVAGSILPDMPNWTGITHIATGAWHIVGLKIDGTVVAAGTVYGTRDGQCEVSGWRGMRAVAAGSFHTVGLKDDGTVVAVGSQLDGDGGYARQCSVSGWTGVGAIAAGSWHTVGLGSDGAVVAVGSDAHGACNVSGWQGITSIAGGAEHTVGLREDGTVVAAGSNQYGQCNVSEWSAITGVAAGGGHTVAIRMPEEPARLQFVAQPKSTSVVQALMPLRVAVRGASGSTVWADRSTVTLSLGGNSAGARLLGTASVVAVSGVATFLNLRVDRPGNGYTLVAASTGVGSAISTPFNVSPAPTRLAFTAPPATTTGGAILSPRVKVAIRDAAGNLVPTAANPVTITIAVGPAGGVILGTTTVAAMAGVATFSDLSLNKAGTYYLRASAPGLTGATSTAFSVAAGPAKTPVFTTKPASTTAGATLALVRVAVQDAYGNTCTSATNAVTVALGVNPTGAVLAGTRTGNAVKGVATFSGLSISKAGTGYTLRATATGLTSAGSTAFNITSAAPAKLVFTVQPSNAAAGVVITPAVWVTVQDRFGNACTTATNAVTTTIAVGPAGARLSGTTTVAAVRGIATFPNLKLDKAGTYYLRASAAGLTGATSTAFTISAGPAKQMAFTRQPVGTTAGATIAPVQVTLQDVFGNPCITAINGVTVALGANPTGAVLGGTRTVNAVKGVATFGGLNTSKAGTGYALHATATGLTGADSSAFNIAPAAPARLVFTVQPSNAAAGGVMRPAVKVAVQDRFGNLCSGAANTVTVTLSGSVGTLAGTRTRNAVAGIATFDDLVAHRSGGTSGSYRIAVTAAGLVGATSNSFTVTGSAAPPVGPMS